MRVVAATVVLSLLSSTSFAQEVAVRQSDAPTCSATQQRDWDLTMRDTLGIIGNDLEQPSLGSLPANRIGRRNWWPLQGQKMPICGRLHHFDWHSGDPFTSADEEDWNNFLIPSDAFQQVFQDNFPADKSQVWKCGDEYCMEAEITPNSKFYENQWWSKKMKKAQLTGKELCAYGPFVEEEWHGKRPEIHPSELYWWKDDESHSYWMLLQEDASGRFDKPQDYANVGHAPPKWQPWAHTPRSAEFRLAFKLDGSHQNATYFINELSSFHAKTVVPSDLKAHSLKFGESTLSATEVGSANEHIKLSFVDLCLTDSNKLQGYLAIKTAVGLEKSPKSGGQELLEITSTQLPVTGPGIEESYAPLRAETPSLNNLNGQPHEVGTLSLPLSVPSAEKITKIDADNSNETAAGRSVLLFGTGARENIQGVDAIKGAELEVETQSGEKKQLEIPPLGLALAIKQQVSVPTGTGVAGPDTAALVKAAGGNFQSNLALDTVQYKEVELVLGIHYAPVESGEVRAEDNSPFSERLNAVLVKNDPSEIKKALGTLYPFKAEWKFEGREYFPDGTSKEFPVVSNGPASESQIGTHWHSRTMNPTVAVEFPQGKGRLFRVEAIGTYVDPSGAKGEITNEIWNQEILSPRAAVDNLLNVVASVVGLTDVEKKALMGPKANVFGPLEYLADPDVRRSDLLRLKAQRASQNGRVSIEDFRDLVSKAKALAVNTSQ
jgi:hypothetical protein